MPAPAKAPIVVSRSFENYSFEEIACLMAENPSSFLHVINPNFRQQQRLKGEVRSKMVRERFEDFIRNGILVRRQKPALYLYEQSCDESCYRGLLCATSTADYRNHVIKRHEATLAKREMLFARYLNSVRFNAEPVLMMYPDDRGVGRILGEVSKEEPDYDFRTPEGKRHKVWIVSEPDMVLRLQELFAGMGALYIADGHHRTASSNLMAQTASAANSTHTGHEAYNYFMSCLLPESEIKIYAYTRLVKDLGGQSGATLLSKLKEEFQIDLLGESARRPENRHSFCMYLDHQFYTLRLKARYRIFDTPVDRLDSQILYTKILRPFLGIKDLRTDRRLAHGFGAEPFREIKSQVDQGKYAIGFSMAPPGVAQIKVIADAGQQMPPKSTYIEPKLRSGLTIYEF
jgi:uncharacterized protein (DUF1015 family)